MQETGCMSAQMCASMHLMAQERPVLIVFDLDGVISDSRLLGRALFKRVFALMGYGEISDELADSFNGPSADEVCRVMGVEADMRARYDQLIDEEEPKLVRTIGRAFAGSQEMVSVLSRHAVIAILSNGAHAYCNACMEEFGLSPYISLCSGFVSGVSKAEHMKRWRESLDARRVIAVGDRGSDVRYAREAGAYAVGVTYGMGTREELEDADALCDTPYDVVAACMAAIELA